MKGKVYLVGAGPGDYKLMTLKGLECIRKSDVIVYDRLANINYLKEAKEDCEFINVGKASSNHLLPQGDINRLIADKALEGKVVTRLKGGDPYVFGRGGEEAEILRNENIDFEVVPGITSAIGGLCYAGIPITHRDHASSFHVITGHPRNDGKETKEIDWKALAHVKGTLVFLMGIANLKHISENLIKEGKDKNTPVAFISWATRSNQRVVTTTLENAYEAGVKVKMLTGDNINTAKAIGEELGLLKENKKAVEATYIDILSDEELREEINDISIVARSKPETKMRIVQALQSNSEVVAVTGDGINDAPALSKADVGISMGISGTEVSKNASDIILTDDSFNTIVDGIKWGRGIYENFQRFIQFQLTINIVAFVIAVMSQIMNREMPFTTIQLLFINIIMDGPPALALGLEPVRDYVLKRKPIKRTAGIIARSMAVNITINAFLIISIISLQEFYNILQATPQEKSTVVFCLFAFTALFNAFNCREFGLNSIITNFFKNKLALEVILITAIVQILLTQIFRSFFNSVALGIDMWIKILLLSSMVLVLNEIVKFILRMVRKII
mgnify:CR=1 FL=1